VTEKRGRPVSRRGLLGLFGAPAKSFRESLEREADTLKPGAAPAAPAGPQRRLRPAEDTVEALLEETGAWGVDLRRKPLEVGRSWRLTGEGLAEPLLAARVSWTHVAVVGGECPVDGSDLRWSQEADRVHCPACGSRWRLDGASTRGPADSRLAVYVAEESLGILHLRTSAAGGSA
jgi:hypothetical protein